MPKKILFVNTTFRSGGAASLARSLFFNLDKSKYDTYFAYGRGEKDQEGRTFKFGFHFETLIHIFLVRFLALDGYGSYFPTRKLIRYIKKEKFDAIHLHNLHGYYLNVFVLFKFLKKSGIPVFWSLHDEWALTSLLAHSVGCSHCKTGLGKCTSSYSYPVTHNQTFLPFLLKKKQQLLSNLPNLHIIPTALWLDQEVKQSFLKNCDREAIQNGVNTNLFKPRGDTAFLRQKYNLPTDKKIILFGAANLEDENKGVKYIIQTAKILENQDYFFVGIGNGNIINQNNLKILNYMESGENLAEIFSLADLFVTTSRAETGPVVVLEAFASGLPVVAFEIAALRELVMPELGGMVPYGKVEELAQMIESNLVLETKIQKSKNVRNIAIQKFSLEIYVKNYSDFYQKIIE